MTNVANNGSFLFWQVKLVPSKNNRKLFVWINCAHFKLFIRHFWYFSWPFLNAAIEDSYETLRLEDTLQGVVKSSY